MSPFDRPGKETQQSPICYLEVTFCCFRTPHCCWTSIYLNDRNFREPVCSSFIHITFNHVRRQLLGDIWRFLYTCWVFMELTLTLPALVADTQLLPGEVAVTVVGAATVVPAVRDVAGLAFPILVTFTVHSAGGRVARRALSMARAVIGTRVDPGQKSVFI